MNNTKLISELLALALFITGGILLKPVMSWVLNQLYKLFISSGYLR